MASSKLVSMILMLCLLVAPSIQQLIPVAPGAVVQCPSFPDAISIELLSIFEVTPGSGVEGTVMTLTFVATNTTVIKGSQLQIGTIVTTDTTITGTVTFAPLCVLNTAVCPLSSPFFQITQRATLIASVPQYVSIILRRSNTDGTTTMMGCGQVPMTTLV